ncbi:MAG: glycerate kinase [Bacteroidales bacterium]|nr:glycerate kinase [Bacteroidales bacterium]
MNIVIAPDSFKDCLTSPDVAKFIEMGIRNVFPDANIKLIPMADGGEGTVVTLVTATNGKIFYKKVHDPLMREITAHFGVLGDGETAVIEMASASGIELLKKNKRDPWKTTTYGTGELIKHALDKGCRKIILGIGGSATNDAGSGMLQALGVQLLDVNMQEIETGGGALENLVSIKTDKLDKRLNQSKIIIASDVMNPLLGKTGASAVYGPQKGADSDMVRRLEANLEHFADVVKQQQGISVENIPGSGAAGGLGAGILAFLPSEIKPGFDIVKEVVELEKYIQDADLVITAEGKIDSQTAYGKTPAGVAGIAHKYNIPVIAFAGIVEDGINELYKKGFRAIIPIANKPMSINESIKKARELLVMAAEQSMRLIQTGELLSK